MEATVARTETTQIITLPLGRARKPWVPIRRQVTKLRRWLETAVVEIHGGIDLRLAKLVRTACTAFESAQRIRRTLAYSGEPGTVAEATSQKADEGGAAATLTKTTGLTHAEWLAYDSALQARESACDKALAALGLDRDARQDVWADVLNGHRIAQDGPQAAQAPHAESTPIAERESQLNADQSEQGGNAA